jgi:P-type E1-E2 ATPase
MIHIPIPGLADLSLEHLVLDINGTLTTDGRLLPGVAERMDALREQVQVHLLTADTRGTAQALAEQLQASYARVQPGQEAEQKRAFLQSLGADQVAAIGNGNNDALMLAAARLGIAVIGDEGCAKASILAADIVTNDIKDALDLLLQPTRLLSTLRR